MEDRVHERVLHILREQPTGALPLRAVHRALVADPRLPVGSYAHFVREVNHRTDLYVVIEPQDPLGEADAWPPEMRAAYESALRAAGIERTPRIALANVAVTPGEDGLRAAERSLVELWIADADDPVRRIRLANAIAQIEAMRQALQGDRGDQTAIPGMNGDGDA